MNKLLVLSFTLLFVAMSAEPAFAQAGAINSAVDWLVELLTSGIARGVAIVGCAVLGYMAWAGKLTWEKAVQFVIGIALVFGAATLVDLLIGVTS